MADITPTFVESDRLGWKNIGLLVFWEGIDAEGSGLAVELPMWPHRTVMAVGMWDSNTITIQGSMDGTNFVTLTDPLGNNAAFTDDSVLKLDQSTKYVQIVQASGSSVSIDVYLALMP